MQQAKLAVLPTAFTSLLRTTALGLVLCVLPMTAMADTNWTGAVDNDWFNAENWTAGVPDGATDTYADAGTLLVDASAADTNFLRLGLTDGAVSNITVSNGGTVQSHSTATSTTLGFNTGSISTGTVTGSGSTWTSNRSFIVGGYGTGTLTIENGGAITNNYGYIGIYTGSIGTITVTEAGSAWNNLAQLRVGKSGTGTLTVEDGGAVSNTAGYIGAKAGAIGTATVTGAGSTWTNSSSLYVGNSGTGTLIVENGGHVANTTGYIGYDVGSTGTASVAGNGSTWVNSSELRVGNSGTGILTIEDGGAVSSSASYIGYNAGATGTATITGDGSTWTSSGELRVGNYGTGMLTIEAGGHVNNTDAAIGVFPNSVGEVLVTGSGSIWNNDGTLYVGDNWGGVDTATGNLTISSGGSVIDIHGNVGRIIGGIGTVIIKDVGSTWVNSSTLTIGENGEAVVTLRDNAVVVSPITHIAQNATSTGTLNIGAASGDAAVAAGVLDTATVAFGAGTGTLLFNHTNTVTNPYLFMPDITGAGTIIAEGGVTSLMGDLSGFTGMASASSNATLNFGAASTFAGDLEVDTGGTLIANNTMAGAVVVNDGGTLKGSGTVGGVAVASGGIVAPGNSIGTINIAGNITFAGGSFLDNELNASGATDLTHATGTATITGGTVRLLPELSSDNILIGNVYTVLTADGGVSGTFDAVTMDSLFLAPSLSYDATNVYASVARNGTALVSAAITYDQTQVAAALDTASNAALSVAASQSSYANAQIAFSALEGGFHANVKRTVTQGGFAFVDLMSGADTPTYWSTYYGDAYTGGAFSADRQGIAFGRVVTVGDDAMAGLAAAVGHTDIEDQPEDTAKINHYRIGAHYVQNQGDFTFKGQAQYSYHSIGTKRLISIPQYSATHKADYDAHSLMGRAEVTYNTKLGEQLSFQPYAAFAYGYSYLSDFQETGGSATLSADSDASTQGAVSFGVRMAQDLTIQNLPAKLRTSLGFEHKLGEKTPTGAYRFDGSQEFISHGTRWAQSSLVFDAELDLSLTETMALNFKYGTIQGADSTSHSGRAGINWKF